MRISIGINDHYDFPSHSHKNVLIHQTRTLLQLFLALDKTFLLGIPKKAPPQKK